MQIDLTGKTVLVTGASRGIGKAIAEACAGAGAQVAVHYNTRQEDARELANALGNGATTFQADLTDPCAAQQLWDDVLEAFGKVDVLVNNAGIAVGCALDSPLDEWLGAWDQTLNANLKAVGVLCKAAVGYFQPNGGGRIVNIASRAAFRGDAPDYLAYAASKGGVVALTRSIARAFGKSNIVAFTVAPGYTRTDMAEPFIEQYGEDVAIGDIALNRMTEPEDIAPLVVLLASGLADHATGTTIDVNAGSYVR